jgi:hypothetical protein
MRSDLGSRQMLTVVVFRYGSVLRERPVVVRVTVAVPRLMWGGVFT